MEATCARWIVCVFSITALAGCAEPTAPTESLRPVLGTAAGPALVECPTSETQRASAEIGPLGGSVSVAGSKVIVPLGALLLPTTITLTVPESNYMEIGVTANDLEHFEFIDAVTVTIDYSRCTRSNIDKGALSVWYIASSTKALLEHMGGEDDKLARTVTFTTDHLSSYAVAD